MFHTIVVIIIIHLLLLLLIIIIIVTIMMMIMMIKCNSNKHIILALLLLLLLLMKPILIMILLLLLIYRFFRNCGFFPLGHTCVGSQASLRTAPCSAPGCLAPFSVLSAGNTTIHKLSNRGSQIPYPNTSTSVLNHSKSIISLRQCRHAGTQSPRVWTRFY